MNNVMYECNNVTKEQQKLVGIVWDMLLFARFLC